MKWYDRDWQVQYMLDSNTHLDYRRIWWRVLPSELPILKRWFFNQWNEMFHAYKYIGGRSESFTKDEYYNVIRPMKTVGEVLDYLRKQKVIIEERHDRKLNKHEIWPDE